jgi:hypothetical protein
VTIAAAAAGAFIIIAIYLIGMRLAAIQRELDEMNLEVLELFNMAQDRNRRGDLKVESARSSGGEIPNEDPDNAPGLEAKLDRVDALCAKLITLVPPANEIPLPSEKELLEAGSKGSGPLR